MIYNYDFYTQLVSAKENDIDLVLEEKNIFYTKDFINDSYYITLYKDITQKEVIDNININDLAEEFERLGIFI